MAVSVIDRDNVRKVFDSADSWWVDDEGYLHVVSGDKPYVGKVGSFEAKPLSTANVATFNKVAWQYVQAEDSTIKLSRISRDEAINIAVKSEAAGLRVLVVSPSKVLTGSVQSANAQELRKAIERRSTEQLANGSIRFVNDKSVRGHTADVVIVDGLADASVVIPCVTPTSGRVYTT